VRNGFWALLIVTVILLVKDDEDDDEKYKNVITFGSYFPEHECSHDKRTEHRNKTEN